MFLTLYESSNTANYIFMFSCAISVSAAAAAVSHTIDKPSKPKLTPVLSRLVKGIKEGNPSRRIGATKKTHTLPHERK